VTRTVIAVLFPIFASYKALRTSDPAQLSPWLMFWVVSAILSTIEFHLSFILTWVPLYWWLRFGLYLYLILPGQQGATYIYQTHVHPFLVQHEADIDRYISEGHDQAKALGLQYMKAAVEWIKVHVLGLPPREPTPPPSRASSGSYAQQLLSRFNLPSARAGVGAPAGDFYGLVASALALATSGAAGGSAGRDAAAEDLSASGVLIPPSLRGYDEKMGYVAAQRERLRLLLQAFDREAFLLAGQEDGASAGAAGANLAKSRSELDFENLEADELAGRSSDNAGKPASPGVAAGWMPWNWSGAKPGAEDTGRSSGVDAGR